MRMFNPPPAANRWKRPAAGLVRLAAALSGTAIAGLALAPPAVAATAVPVRTSAVRGTPATVAPMIYLRHPRAIPAYPACQLWTDGESYAEAYCAPICRGRRPWALHSSLIR
jgi:hypothetical protein